MMLAEKKAPQQVSAAMLIPFRRERARALRVLALAALTTTTAPQGTTRRCADEQPSPTELYSCTGRLWHKRLSSRSKVFLSTVRLYSL